MQILLTRRSQAKEAQRMLQEAENERVQRASGYGGGTCAPKTGRTIVPFK